MSPFPILLSGIKHCGKSTLGEMVAQRLEIPFIDTDNLLMDAIHTTHADITLREWYSHHGAEAFYELEYQTIIHLLGSLPKDQWYMISLGGGMCDNARLYDHLSRIGQVFYLYQPEEVLRSRILRNGTPPFLDAKDPVGSFHDLFTRRDQRYQQIAHEVITLEPDGSFETNAEILLSAILPLVREEPPSL